MCAAAATRSRRADRMPDDNEPDRQRGALRSLLWAALGVDGSIPPNVIERACARLSAQLDDGPFDIDTAPVYTQLVNDGVKSDDVAQALLYLERCAEDVGLKVVLPPPMQAMA